MEIVLRGKYIVTHVKKRTQARLFKELKLYDIVDFSIPIKRAGCNDGRTYASYVTVENVKTGDKVTNSFNQISRFLKCFEFIEYK